MATRCTTQALLGQQGKGKTNTHKAVTATVFHSTTVKIDLDTIRDYEAEAEAKLMNGMPRAVNSPSATKRLSRPQQVEALAGVLFA